MTQTSRAVRDELDSLLLYLLDAEIALYVNPVVQEEGRVTWRGLGAGGEFLPIRESESIAAYRAWIEMGAYSALLSDGALLQMTYEFSGHDLVGHRLAWVPCPFNVDRDLLQTAPPVDVFDLYAGESKNVFLRSAVRFDFDVGRAAPDHPAVHLSLNASHCRIACAAPLRVGHFVEFVFRNFYPATWRAHPYLGRMSKRRWCPHLITEDQVERLHVSWRR